MKTNVYFLTYIVLSGCLLLSLHSFAEDADKESVAEDADKESVENKEQNSFFRDILYNLCTKQRFEKVPEDIYIDPETCQEIILKPFYEEEDGVVKKKINHEQSSNVLRVFNKDVMQKFLTKTLESGEKVMLVPAGAVILKEEVSYLELAKNVSLGCVGLAALIGIYDLLSGNNSSQITNTDNSSQTTDTQIENK